MRTTLNIDNFLINKLLECTHEKSKTKAITIAIQEYLKKKNLEKILSYQGSLDIGNNWQQLEEEELKEYSHEELYQQFPAVDIDRILEPYLM